MTPPPTYSLATSSRPSTSRRRARCDGPPGIPTARGACSSGTAARLSASIQRRNASSRSTRATKRNLRGAAFSRDGRGALLVGNQGAVLLFDGSTVRELASPTTENLRRVAWHPTDGSALIVGNAGTVLRYARRHAHARPRRPRAHATSRRLAAGRRVCARRRVRQPLGRLPPAARPLQVRRHLPPGPAHQRRRGRLRRGRLARRTARPRSSPATPSKVAQRATSSSPTTAAASRTRRSRPPARSSARPGIRAATTRCSAAKAARLLRYTAGRVEQLDSRTDRQPRRPLLATGRLDAPCSSAARASACTRCDMSESGTNANNGYSQTRLSRNDRDDSYASDASLLPGEPLWNERCVLAGRWRHL